MAYQTEKQLKELGDKIPADVKEKVEAKLADLRHGTRGTGRPRRLFQYP